LNQGNTTGLLDLTVYIFVQVCLCYLLKVTLVTNKILPNNSLNWDVQDVGRAGFNADYNMEEKSIEQMN